MHVSSQKAIRVGLERRMKEAYVKFSSKVL